MKREEIDSRFLELVRRICQYGEFESGRDEMCRELDRLVGDGKTRTMHRDLPWLTDVFFRGVLAGEDVQAAARRQLVGEWQTLTDSACPTSGGVDDRREKRTGQADPKPFVTREVVDESSLQTMDKMLRQLPRNARDEEVSRFRKGLKGIVRRTVGAKRFLDWVRCWLGKHGPLSLADYREWGEEELYSCAERQADEERLLKSCETASFETSQDFIVANVRKKASALLSARDRVSALRLTWLPDGGAERLVNEIDCLEILHSLAVAVAYGLNHRGVGCIPAMRLSGRKVRDGGIISDNPDEFGNVNMVLDTLAMNAFLKLMDIREVGGCRVPCFGPLRRYLNGPFQPTYLVGILQNTVANLRGGVLLDPNGEPIFKETTDAPVGMDDGQEGRTILDTLKAPDDDTEEEDQARFFRTVVGSLAPNLFRYFRLIRDGKSKGEALKVVGAKSTHFVEREAKTLIKELAKLKGEDVTKLSKMLNDLVEGK